jgi:hypothetical protein
MFYILGQDACLPSNGACIFDWNQNYDQQFCEAIECCFTDGKCYNRPFGKVNCSKLSFFVLYFLSL